MTLNLEEWLLKIQLCITRIKLHFKYIKTENCYFNLKQYFDQIKYKLLIINVHQHRVRVYSYKIHLHITDMNLILGRKNVWEMFKFMSKYEQNWEIIPLFFLPGLHFLSTESRRCLGETIESLQRSRLWFSPCGHRRCMYNYFAFPSINSPPLISVSKQPLAQDVYALGD